MDRESYLELESILRDIKAERAKPRHLPFEFFKYITDNLSPDLEVGRGGFGVVYKGVLKYGEIVVVKRLRAAPGTLDKQYENEAHLLRLKHENIVRILGYCSEARQELIQHEGKFCPAYILERLICLEYMPNGSLDRYIKDASSGLIWNQRFKIIKGICCGLHFLHEENQINAPVIHLDLTPANILLTNGMVPKITDFGLSRLFGGQQTRIYTAHNIGKRGYMAPEFWLRGKITKKSDIFSLGVIILEMITGNKDYPWSNDTTTVQNYVKIEVQKWRARMMEDLSFTFVEKNCLQIKNCIEIGLECVHTDEMKRPTTEDIIEVLNRSLDNSNAPSSRVSVDSTAQTGHPGAGDWREDIYQTIKSLKDQHLAELSDMSNKMSMKLHHIDNHMPSQKQTEQYEKMRTFKLLLDRTVHFLQIDKSNIHPDLKENIPAIEKQIVDIVNSQRRKPVQAPGFAFTEINCWRTRNSKVVCCRFSSDGMILANAGHEKKVVLWNVENFQTLYLQEEHALIITDICFRPNSSQLATSSFDRTIKLWNTANPGFSLLTLTGHHFLVVSLDFHPKKTDLLCSCDINGEIRYWNVTKHTCLHAMKGGSTQVRFQPNAGQFLAAAAENVVSIFDIETHGKKYTLQGHNTDVKSISWDNSGEYLASVSLDLVKIWSISSGECIRELSSNGNKFHSCVFHPFYTNLLVIGCYENLELWNMVKNQSMTVQAHGGLVAALAQTPVTGMVASASHDSSVKLWK